MFIVLSLFTLCLFLVGYLATPFLRAEGRLFEQVALTIGLGLLINYCLVLTGLTLTRVLIAGIIMGLLGALKFSSDLRGRLKQGIRERETTVFAACGLTYLLAVYYLEILSEPLLRWDARSVWFFQAKMIWIEGAFRQQAGWAHPSLVFSSPAYPKLVPVIAAQLASVKGYWNEFFPKGSLLVMLVPLLFWIFSFRKKSVGFLLLVLVYFFSLDSWLGNGYMDAYLFMYCGVALLLFGRYLSGKRDTDLYSAICALGIAASLKNEGLLFGSCFVTALLCMSARRWRLSFQQFAKRIRTDSLFVRALLLSIAPTLMWAICRYAWGLQNNLTADVPSVVSRLSSRLFDGASPQYVLRFLILQASAIWAVVGLLVVTVVFSVYQKVELHRGALVAAATSALYFCGLYVAYLITPTDLFFLLSTSAARTMATASVGLLVCLFFLLSGLEVNEGAAGPIDPLQQAGGPFGHAPSLRHNSEV